MISYNKYRGKRTEHLEQMSRKVRGLLEKWSAKREKQKGHLRAPMQAGIRSQKRGKGEMKWEKGGRPAVFA
jgi:hypothetical protein